MLSFINKFTFSRTCDTCYGQSRLCIDCRKEVTETSESLKEITTNFFSDASRNKRQKKVVPNMTSTSKSSSIRRNVSGTATASETPIINLNSRVTTQTSDVSEMTSSQTFVNNVPAIVAHVLPNVAAVPNVDCPTLSQIGHNGNVLAGNDTVRYCKLNRSAIQMSSERIEELKRKTARNVFSGKQYIF